MWVILLHRRDQAPRLRKGEDTMDVWFDSGSSWAGVVEANPNLRSDISMAAAA